MVQKVAVSRVFKARLRHAAHMEKISSVPNYQLKGLVTIASTDS